MRSQLIGQVHLTGGDNPPPPYGPLVKRLRRQPLTLETRVRFPEGSPLGKAHKCVNMDL